MRAGIAGIGTYYPPDVRHNDAWPEDFRERGRGLDRTFNDIPSGSNAASVESFLAQEASDPFLGAKQRRVADPTETAVDAETEAATVALRDAGVLGEDVDVVISYSMVPDRLMPATAGAVATRLGARSARAFGIDAACATLVPQLEVALALVRSGQAKNVLLTQSHLLLRAFPLLHPAAPGLGDGAAAVVIRADARWPVLATHSVTDGSLHDAVTWVRDGDDVSEVPWWKAGGSYRLGSHDRAQAKQLMKDTVAIGAKTVRELCAKAGVPTDRIERLFSVQPRAWIPGCIARELGLPSGASVCTYEMYAHLGACGPLANLDFAYRSGEFPLSGLAAIYAQGAGFTRAGALLAMD